MADRDFTIQIIDDSGNVVKPETSSPTASPQQEKVGNPGAPEPNPSSPPVIGPVGNPDVTPTQPTPPQPSSTQTFGNTYEAYLGVTGTTGVSPATSRPAKPVVVPDDKMEVYDIYGMRQVVDKPVARDIYGNEEGSGVVPATRQTEKLSTSANEYLNVTPEKETDIYGMPTGPGEGLVKPLPNTKSNEDGKSKDDYSVSDALHFSGLHRLGNLASRTQQFAESSLGKSIIGSPGVTADEAAKAQAVAGANLTTSDVVETAPTGLHSLFSTVTKGLGIGGTATAATEAAATATAGTAATGTAAAGTGTAAAGGAAALLSNPVGIAIAAGLAAIAIPLASIAVTLPLVASTKDYTPQIAEARAVVEVDKFMMDQRRAGYLSPEVSENLLAMQDINRGLADITNMIGKPLLKIANDALAVINDIAMPALTVIVTILTGLLELTSSIFSFVKWALIDGSPAAAIFRLLNSWKQDSDKLARDGLMQEQKAFFEDGFLLHPIDLPPQAKPQPNNKGL